MLKVMSIFGTRPEAVKMAPVVRELQRHPGRIRSVVCVTAQHREMLDQVLEVFGIKPDHDLDLMRPNQSLPDLTARVIQETTRILQAERPDVVLVQGDTTTVMATALAAFYERIPVGHVEAGLRTDDPYNPFPEEMNRRLASAIAAYHFAPTETAAEALRREGIEERKIFVTGNTVVDALQQTLASGHEPAIPVPIAEGRRLVLATTHRRENFGEPLKAICRGIDRILDRFPDVEVVLPVHPNPNVAGTVRAALEGRERAHLVPPMDYVSFTRLLSRAYFVLTDSGGVQEEAPALGKPALVLRNETERPEGVTAGVAMLIGPDEERIVHEASRLLTDEAHYRRMASGHSLYGDGHASGRIVAALLASEARVEQPAA